MIENEYYSNCLIEAIKVKMKYPATINIHAIIGKRDGKCRFHFYWTDKDTGDKYHFHTDSEVPFYKWIWWKGNIQKINYEQTEKEATI